MAIWHGHYEPTQARHYEARSRHGPAHFNRARAWHDPVVVPCLGRNVGPQCRPRHGTVKGEARLRHDCLRAGEAGKPLMPLPCSCRLLDLAIGGGGVYNRPRPRRPVSQPNPNSISPVLSLVSLSSLALSSMTATQRRRLNSPLSPPTSSLFLALRWPLEPPLVGTGTRHDHVYPSS